MNTRVIKNKREYWDIWRQWRQYLKCLLEKKMLGQWDGSVVKALGSEAWQVEKPSSSLRTPKKPDADVVSGVHPESQLS